MYSSLQWSVVFCPSSITEWPVLDCAHIQLRAVRGHYYYYVSQNTTSLLKCMHPSSGAMFWSLYYHTVTGISFIISCGASLFIKSTLPYNVSTCLAQTFAWAVSVLRTTATAARLRILYIIVASHLNDLRSKARRGLECFCDTFWNNLLGLVLC